MRLTKSSSGTITSFVPCNRLNALPWSPHRQLYCPSLHTDHHHHVKIAETKHDQSQNQAKLQ